MSTSYEDRVRQQIAQYANTENIHDLPAIFHQWSHNYLRQAIETVFEVPSTKEFYASAFRKSTEPSGSTPSFLSIGCGDGSLEIDVADVLVGSGFTDFKFYCADLSPILIEKFKAKIPAHLSKCLVPYVVDLNMAAERTKYNAIMAHHSLHHIENLEGIFKMVHSSLVTNGIFATNDMIGRNGHLRWPETRYFIEYFWPFLRHDQRFHRQLNRLELEFLDHDCSNEGFEGIRAQDILGLILGSGFSASHFLGCGGFIDLMVDRGYGPGLNATDPNDLFLMHRMALMNELALDAGLIKPTIMFAYFVKYPTEEKCFRGRTAARSVRDPLKVPQWLAWAKSDAEIFRQAPEFTFRDDARGLETTSPHRRTLV